MRQVYTPVVMTEQFKLTKMFTRQNHPDFLDLPWEAHLSAWNDNCSRIVEVERGRSRHEVVFVHYDKIYAVKELPNDLGKYEYQILRKLEEEKIEAVKPVGYASIENIKTGENRSIVITEYLKSSLPYRSIFMRSDLLKYQEKLLNALAVLLVTLHIKKVYWGDCSLSNILFRRDAGELQAYLVDAETSEMNSTISDSKREYELTVMQENLAGELMDLAQIISLPDGFDYFEIGTKVTEKYHQLWSELNSDETIKRSENYKINEKIDRINQLGFTVDEIEMTTTGEGDEIRIKPKVTDRNYHQDKFQNLTGFSTEENVARKLLSEIYEIKAQLTKERKRETPLSNAAYYWNNNYFYPIAEKLDLLDETSNALQTYAEILDFKNEMQRREHRDITIEEAAEMYKKQVMAKREMHLFKRGFRRPRTKDNQVNKRILSTDWKQQVIYQIYPRSFFDSDANGVGDIPGIIEKMDYIKWLGATAIRLNSIQPSPMNDMGYDVTHFKSVEPMFGDIKDFTQLIEEAHARDLKVILDLVPSHTSIEHSWFKESQSSIDNPKRDWYIWRKPKENGGPPNNWLSITGESAWTFDEQTGEYYLHSFLESEPDLNWNNKELRKKMLGVIRFWLNLGVDGILLVMLSWLAKDDQLRDDPKNPNYDPSTELPYNANIPIYSYDRPELLDYVKMIADEIDQFEDRILIAEIDQFSPLESYLEEYSVADLIDMPLNFRFVELDWDAMIIKNFIDQYEEVHRGDHWPNYILSTHDFPRLINRIGREQARVAAVLLLTIRGTPLIYYGQELGMVDVGIPSSYMRDPWSKFTAGKQRDPHRSPMQWNNKKHAGFTDGEPWLPISGDYEQINVNKETYIQSSMLNLYRELLELRRQIKALRLGDYIPEDSPFDDCLVYIRTNNQDSILVILNFSNQSRKFDIKKYDPDILLLTSYLDQKHVYLDQYYVLRPNEAIVVLLN